VNKKLQFQTHTNIVHMLEMKMFANVDISN